MGSFWLWGAGLGLLASGFVLWPLLRQGSSSTANDGTAARDEVVLDLYRLHLEDLQKQLDAGEISQDEFDKLSQENELALLEDTAVSANETHRSGGKLVLWLIAFLVPALATMMYWQRGSQEDLAIQSLRQELMSIHFGSEADVQKAQVLSQQLKQRIHERVKSQPDNLQYWYSLARMSVGEGDYALAVEAYQAILQAEPDNAKMLSELAQAQFLLAENKVTPVVSGLIAQALAKNPQEPTALGLAGIEAFEQQNYASAVTYWRRAIAQLGPNAPGAEALEGGIQRARALMGDVTESDAIADAAADSAEDAVDQPRVVLNVSLGDAAEATPEQLVYVYARAWQGPKMPLAITRIRVADLPAQVTLDNTMSMMAGMNLSSVPELELVARISRDGGPVAQEGDWQASKGPLSLSQLEDELSLVIDSQL
ncbi:c-type cytochrome biogenesis protein CcmI [Maricurvus nonylphenolicus]|uniref:c-type cytochrome biogenesis protein CcmI n=1 Tax=Maricurvus nonylphenolicus TaxID=1008307 RepID=UPI0036F1B7C8